MFNLVYIHSEIIFSLFILLKIKKLYSNQNPLINKIGHMSIQTTGAAVVILKQQQKP